MTAQAPKVAVVLTQIATADALAAACAMSRIAVDAVTSPVGSYAVCRDASGDAPQELAKAVSALVRSVPLILFEAQDGQVSASQWQAGERTGSLAPALVLDGAPHELEDILLGARQVGDVEGVVSSVGMSRWKAARRLAATARAARPPRSARAPRTTPPGS
ncbi:hypothetical protein [Sanguibacter suaedae]|uniref:Uncharacterized protein n=1 Tax=Sanguibacter suaedae TaxID=2795737 RepID=A0A934I734_9MICO|nr:hypothetical protein [Sanguibacter suaedae]MBI9115441.1 hypothetical protein [Sanguibacter suaedae]